MEIFFYACFAWFSNQYVRNGIVIGFLLLFDGKRLRFELSMLPNQIRVSVWYIFHSIISIGKEANIFINDASMQIRALSIKVYLGINERQSDTVDWYFMRQSLENHIFFLTHRLCCSLFRLAGTIKLFMSDFVILSSSWIIATKMRTKKSICVNWFGFIFE